MRKPLTLLLMFAGALAADCVDGGRNTTEAERSFSTATMQALQAALPPAPAGWEARPDKILLPANSVCKGSNTAIVSYRATYLWMDGAKELNRQQDEFSRQIAAIRAIPADKQQQMSELSRQNRALYRELPKARAAGNTAEVERINAEMKRLTAEAFQIKRAHEESVRPQIDQIVQQQIAATQGRSLDVKITLRANDANAKVGLGITRRDGETILMIGKPTTPSYNSLEVRNVVVTLKGSPEHIDLFLKSWNTEALAALTSTTPSKTSAKL